MTKEETKKRIEVMEAYASGQQVESRERHDGKWSLAPSPWWNWELHDYRIKPARRVVPLGPEDIRPGDVVHYPAWPKEYWRYIQPTGNGGIIGDQGTESWLSLKVDGWLISHDSGKTWQKCEKIQEAAE